MITAVSGVLLKVFGMDLLMIEIVNNIIEPVSAGLFLYKQSKQVNSDRPKIWCS